MIAGEDILCDLPDFLNSRNICAGQGRCCDVENAPSTTDPLLLCCLRTGFVSCGSFCRGIVGKSSSPLSFRTPVTISVIVVAIFLPV